MIQRGDHIIWHIPKPHGEPVIFTGQVKHVNEFGAIVNKWGKDSKGNRQCIPEFHSFQELARCQVVGTGAVCE